MNTNSIPVAGAVPHRFACVSVAGVLAFMLAMNPLRVLGGVEPVPTRQFGFGIEVSAAFAPDGQSALFAGSNAQLYDVGSGQLIRQFPGHSSRVASAVFSPDGNWIVTGSHDGTVRCWDTATGEELWRISRPVGVAKVAISPDGTRLLTLTLDGSGGLWNVANRELIREFESVAGVSAALAFSTDGSAIATVAREGQADGLILIWDSETFEVVTTIQTGVTPVNSLAFSPDGSRLMVALGDSLSRTARLYAIENQEILWSDNSHANIIYTVGFSSDGNQVVTGSADGTVRVIEAETGDEIRTIESLSAASFAISPVDGRLLTSGGGLWNLDDGELVRQFPGRSHPTRSMVISGDGVWMVTGHTDGAARLWETDSGRLLHTFDAHSGPISHVAISAEDGSLLTGSPDGSVKWWDLQTREEIRSMSFPPSAGLTVSSDQTRILTSNGQQNRVFDLETGSEIQMFTSLGGSGEVLAFSPDGSQVAVVQSGGQVKGMPTLGGDEIFLLSTGGFSLLSVMYSADGSRLLTVAPNGASVWDTTTRERVWRSRDGMLLSTIMGAAALSPDGTEVVVLSANGYVSLWNVDSGRMMGVLASKYFLSGSFAAFSADGESILVGDESVVMQWDKSVVKSTVPLTIRNVIRNQNNTLLTVDGPAALAWRVHVQASTDLSSEDNWSEVNPVFSIGDRNISSTLRFSWQSGPRFFRVFVLPE